VARAKTRPAARRCKGAGAPRTAASAQRAHLRSKPSGRSALGPQAARILALAAAFVGCSREVAAPDPAAEALARIADVPHAVAVLEVRDLGEIRIELLPELAPETVASFERLAGEGYFDGTTFHRVIPGFMIQGGDPNTRNNDPRDDGQGGSDVSVPDEFTAYPQSRGTVSMAHRGQPGTAGSQFFIVHADASFLDGHHTAFGRVVDGMPVVDAITALEIDKYGRYGPRDRPYPKAAVIESVRVVPADADATDGGDGTGAGSTSDTAAAAEGS
jgi:peptidyl-prolyl cis-trans isomerase B (cyclophilin B)